MISSLILKILIATLGSIVINSIIVVFLLCNITVISKNKGSKLNLLFILVGIILEVVSFVYIIKLIGWWTVLYAIIGLLIWIVGVFSFAVVG